MPNFEDQWTIEHEAILRRSILELYNPMFRENLNRDMTHIEENNIYDNMKKQYIKFADDNGAMLNDTVQDEFHRASKQYVERLVNSLRTVGGGKKKLKKSRRRRHKKKTQKTRRKRRHSRKKNL